MPIHKSPAPIFGCAWAFFHFCFGCRPETKKAGIKGGSSHSGRRTFASKVLASTGDIEAVATLLGHSSIDCSQRYIDIDPITLSAMFEDAI